MDLLTYVELSPRLDQLVFSEFKLFFLYFRSLKVSIRFVILNSQLRVVAFLLLQIVRQCLNLSLIFKAFYLTHFQQVHHICIFLGEALHAVEGFVFGRYAFLKFSAQIEISALNNLRSPEQLRSLLLHPHDRHLQVNLLRFED